MSIIKQLNNNIPEIQEKIILDELQSLDEQVYKTGFRGNKYGIHDSNVANLPEDMDLDKAFDEATARLAAAKRAIPLVNKLKDPQQRSEHASRVFMNMNRLQALVADIIKIAKTQLQINNDTIKRSQFF